ncbi:hypothetical protein ACVW2K_001139 [Nocardioides sp. HB32]
MTCVKHNLRMVRLVVGGRTRTPEHAALLTAVRRCRRCNPPALPPLRSRVWVPRARVELVDERLHLRR